MVFSSLEISPRKPRLETLCDFEFSSNQDMKKMYNNNSYQRNKSIYIYFMNFNCFKLIQSQYPLYKFNSYAPVSIFF